MPYLTLAAELELMRSGRGPRRQLLREQLAAVDSKLRAERNVARLRQAQAQHQMRTASTLLPPEAISTLQEAAEECARRLAVLDQQVVEAVARQLGKK